MRDYVEIRTKAHGLACSSRRQHSSDASEAIQSGAAD